MSELADGWTWARISDITEKVPNVKPEDYPEKEFGYVDISSICNSTYRITEAKRFKGKDAPSRARRPIRPNDILFSNVRTYLRNIAIVPPDTDAEICSTGFTVLRPSEVIDPRYLFRYVLTNNFIDRVTPQQTGTHYPATSDRVVMSELMPLPPLNEQRRIVVKLEKLLGKVEACQKRLAKIPVILKRFRQSVLAAACSGRLTADWRAEQNVAEDFEDTTVEAIAEYVGGFAYKSATFIETGLQVIRIGNVRPLALNLTASPVSIPAIIASETLRFSLQPNDLVISMTGTKYKRDYYGYAAMVRDSDGSLYLNQRVARLRCKEKVLPKFLLYWLQTDLFREFFFAAETGNVNQGNVGADGIRKAPIDLPSLVEQYEIVRRVEALFALADQIETRYQNAQAFVAKLTQSILSKAFRGELVQTEAELARRGSRDLDPAGCYIVRQ